MENYEVDKYREQSISEKIRKEDAYLRAKKHVKKIVGFYWHLASYIIVNLFLISLIAINTDSSESFWNFGTFSTLFFWGIGLAFHAMGVFGPNLMFGKNWEQKKIDEFMDKDDRKWQ